MRRYGEEPLVRKAMAELAKGKYLKEISAFSWRFMIRAAAILFHIHGYAFFTTAIALLRKLGVDGRITESRNRKVKGKAAGHHGLNH